MKKPMQVQTDLATEARDMYVENERREEEQLKGVTMNEREEDGIHISYVDIDEEGEATLGKKAGSYITIYADGVKNEDTDQQEKAARVLAKAIERIIGNKNISADSTGLIVGLGNWNVTPDALGPMKAEKILVTSHLF